MLFDEQTGVPYLVEELKGSGFYSTQIFIESICRIFLGIRKCRIISDLLYTMQ